MYRVNDNYFEIIDSREKAYFLGLLTADGCVHKAIPKKRRHRISLELKIEDKYIIESFAKAINFNGNINTVTIRKGKYTGHQYAKIEFTSDKMAEDLAKYGVVNNKTYIEYGYPSIPQEYDNDFIRGYFDGNGSVFISNEKHWRKGHIFPVIHFRFIGQRNLLETIKNKLNLKGRFYKSKRSFIYELSYKRRTQASLFFNKIYNDTNLYLKRKYEIFKDVQRLQSSTQYVG